MELNTSMKGRERFNRKERLRKDVEKSRYESSN